MKHLSGSVLFASMASAVLFLGILPASQAATHPPAKRLVGKARVSYADLDLNRPSDVQILLDRIEEAAYHACGGNPRRHPGYGLIPRRTEAVYAECQRDALARAVRKVNTPLLLQARLRIASK
jgi:UrcA family protein